MDENDVGRPQVSPDGRELFYECTERMMSVSVETEPVFKPAMPKILFTKSFRRYDIHPDGDLFLLIKPPERTDDASTDEVPNKIIVVTNWFEELKERVPLD